MASSRTRADAGAPEASSGAQSPRRRRLLTRHFRHDLHAPDESKLTDVQWLVADLMTNLERAFFDENLSTPRRQAIARMQVEWQKAELGDQDLRVLRAVQAVEQAMAELREARTRAVSGLKQKKPTRRLQHGRWELSEEERGVVSAARNAAPSALQGVGRDAEFLVQMVTGAFGGEVFGSALDLRERVLGPPTRMENVEKIVDAMNRFGVARRKRGLRASGVLAVILELGGVPTQGLVKRIDSACTRARKAR